MGEPMEEHTLDNQGKGSVWLNQTDPLTQSISIELIWGSKSM